MKLTTVTNVSLDGVTQGHRRIDAGPRCEAGAPDGYGSSEFERYGWAPPLLDDDASTFISQAFQRADAFLFGRRTYTIFASSWGAGMDPGNPVGEALNTRPKYVASTTLTHPQWAGTTVLSGDVAAIVDLRAEPGGELQVWGQRHPDPLAALPPAGRPDRAAHLSRGRRAGYAALPCHRPGLRTETGRLAVHPKGTSDPDLPHTGRPQYETATT
jgi:dihydrofolate reductase